MEKENGILSFLGTGQENAVTRDELKRLTGLSDRKNRELIEQARNEGHIIVNCQDGKGYYLTNRPEDIKAQMERNRHRALSILVQQKHLKKALKEVGLLNKSKQ